MIQDMFCFQCEQTAGCSGCTKMGVCGKDSKVSQLQDQLSGALIALAHTNRHDRQSDKVILKGLFTTITNVNFNEEDIIKQIDTVRDEKKRLDCKEADYELSRIWEADEDIRSLKSLLLFGIRGMSAYAYHAQMLDYSKEAVNAFFYEGLRAISDISDLELLLKMVLKVGEINLKCMALLDKANTESFGIPLPSTVSLTVEKGPFIVISGHDLKDLQLLLEQTKDQGIQVYTHCEMLPAHAYPRLKAYAHLKGNFGTAWQNQQKEFMNIPAPVVFTTNCLMPPKKVIWIGYLQQRLFPIPDSCILAKKRILHQSSKRRFN